MKRPLVLALIILLLSSCTTLNLNYEPSIKELINATKCERPCWLGIEQGMKSDADEVLSVLEDYYGEQNVILDTGGLIPHPGYQIVAWHVFTKQDNIPLQNGSVSIKNKNQVDSIQVWFDEQWFTVGDLISSVGEPNLVTVINFNNYSPESPCSVFKLFFPNLGLTAFVWHDDDPIKLEKPNNIIEKSNYILGLHFSKSWLATDTKENEIFDKLVNWNGYGDYGQYCVKANP